MLMQGKQLERFCVKNHEMRDIISIQFNSIENEDTRRK